MRSGHFLGKGFYSGVMKMFWNLLKEVVADRGNCIKPTQLLTLKWSILCCFISILKTIKVKTLSIF